MGTQSHRPAGTGRRVSISVLTPALPSRRQLLYDCIESVRKQTYQPADHLIGLDYQRIGCATMLNRLLAATNSDWLALIGDDDLMYPTHLATLKEGAETGADVVYSYCDVDGRPGWNPNSPFDPDALLTGNYIPSTTLIRTALARELGGWNHMAAHGFEDWDFWLRALDAGAQFACIPTVTWCYRFHGTNLSWPYQPAEAVTA